MRIGWTSGARQDYLYWVKVDLCVRDKINTLIGDIQRHLFTGLGKPEPLKRNLRGFGPGASTGSIDWFTE